MPEAATPPAPPAPTGQAGSSTYNGAPPNTAASLGALDAMFPEGGGEPAGDAPEIDPPAGDPPKSTAGEQPPKPAEKTAPDKTAPKTPEAPKAPEKAATLRASYETAKGELAKAQARIIELEKKASTPANEAELKELRESVATTKKERDELLEEIRYVNYEKHPEFKERYVAPMEQAYASGIEEIKGFRVTDENGERHGTEKDFEDFMSIADAEKAWQFAEERFGTKASIMWGHRKNFINAVTSKNKALADFRAKGAERDKMTAEQRATESRQMAEAWQNMVKEGIQKYPKLFAPVEGDTDGNSALDQGMAMADLAFGVLAPENVDKLPTSIKARLVNGQLPKAEQIKLHSAIRNMAGGFGRLQKNLGRAEAKIKELQTKLEAYEASEPTGGGQGGGKGKAPKGEKSWEQQLESFAT